jgi:hypothetical protein
VGVLVPTQKDWLFFNQTLIAGAIPRSRIAIRLQSVCRRTAAFHVLLLPSVTLHVVEFTLSCGFDFLVLATNLPSTFNLASGGSVSNGILLKTSDNELRGIRNSEFACLSFGPKSRFAVITGKIDA